MVGRTWDAAGEGWRLAGLGIRSEEPFGGDGRMGKFWVQPRSAGGVRELE